MKADVGADADMRFAELISAIAQHDIHVITRKLGTIRTLYDTRCGIRALRHSFSDGELRAILQWTDAWQTRARVPENHPYMHAVRRLHAWAKDALKSSRTRQAYQIGFGR